MRLQDTKVMFLLFGYGITVSILTLLMMLGLFGDFTTSKNESTLYQSMQKNLAK